MATLEELVVRIKADASSLEQQLRNASGTADRESKKMKKSFDGVSESLKDLRNYLIAAFGANYLRGIVDGIDRLNDLSNQLDVSTEALSNFQYAAKLSGTSLESVAQGLRFLGNNVSDAAAGTGTAADALRQLGLNAKEMLNLPLDQQFEQVAEALSKIPNQADKLSYVRDIFGRMGADLLPLINDFKELKAEAEAVGYTLGDEAAQRFAALNDEIDRMKLGSEVLARNLLELVVPALNDTLAGVNELFAGLQNTSKLFNNLGAAYVGVLEKIGMVDSEVAQQAYQMAGEQIDKGVTKRTITASGRGRSGAASRRTPSKGGKSNSDDKKQEAQDYDTLNNGIDAYIRNLEIESDLIGKSAKEREGLKAVYEAQNMAIKEGNALTPEQIEHIRNLAEANYELKDSMEEAARFSKELKDQLSNTLTSIILDFKNAEDAAGNFAKAIANTIIQKKITGPLADSIIGALDGGGGGGGILSGIGSFFGGAFADGGSPPMGKVSLVGENGPELFVPRSAGTIIPNDKLGGGGMTFVQNNNFSSGVQRSELQPMLQAAAVAGKNMVFDELQRGGAASRLVRN